MRRFRRYNRFSRHGSRFHGYGRDASKLSWPQFQAEARKQKKYQKRNGSPNHKKISAAWAVYKRTGKVTKSSGKYRTPAFRQRLGALGSLIANIAPSSKRKGGKKSSHRRKLSDAQKLRMIEATLRKNAKALEKARGRLKTKKARDEAAKAAAKARAAARKAKKAANRAAQPSHPATAEADAKKAEQELAEALRASNEAHRNKQKAEAEAAESWRKVAHAAQQEAMFPWARAAMRDKAKKRKGKKTSSKKRSSAKKPKKRSSAKRGRKLTTKHKNKIAAGRKKMVAWKRKEAKKRKYAKYTPKRLQSALNKAWAAYRKRTGRDADSDSFGYDIL